MDKERITYGLKDTSDDLEDEVRLYRTRLDVAFKDENLGSNNFLLQSFDVMTVAQMELLTMYQELITLLGLVEHTSTCRELYSSRITPQGS